MLILFFKSNIFLFRYEEEVTKLLADKKYRSPLGIMRRSIFASIPGVNVFRLFLPDPSHDVIEGYLILLIPQLLFKLSIKKKDLINRMASFTWINGSPVVAENFSISGKGVQVKVHVLYIYIFVNLFFKYFRLLNFFFIFCLCSGTN